MEDAQQKRATDKGFMCWVALRLADFWNFIDKRQIDMHVVCTVFLVGVIRITEWGMAFAHEHPQMSGTEMGIVIAAVLGPYMAVLAPVIKWYFNRGTTIESTSVIKATVP